MRAKAEYPTIHGAQHLPNGSDPIQFVEGAAIYGRIRKDGASSLAITSGFLTATTTLIQHNNISAEVGVECDIVSTPSRITILTAGLYAILPEFADEDTGSADYGLAVGYGFNATGAIWSPTMRVRRILGGFAVPQGETFQELDVGDYVTQVVGQNSGSTKTFNYLANLTVVKITGPSYAPLATIDGGSP